MSFVDSVVQSHSVPEDALTTLTGAQNRLELAEILHDLVKAVTDLHTRIMVLEHPGASPALVQHAVGINDLNLALAIAQEKQRVSPSPINQAGVFMVQQQIAAAKAATPEVAAVQPETSPVSAVLKDLLAGGTTSAQ